MKRAFLAAILVVASSAGACINDRDTLAFEMRNVDALKRVHEEKDPKKRVQAIQEIALKAIGGRFERFPPKYYEMRIARLEAQPSLTAFEYDDLAVAYERLGKTDKAIGILLASKPHRKTEDDEYRFHANYGTFLVHKWLAQKDRTDKSALEDSIHEIETALKINPDSHFGREKVQLWLETEWAKQGSGAYTRLDNDLISFEDFVVGLSGIAMMGLGYELPDVYRLMASDYLRGQAGVSLLQPLAMNRFVELQNMGIASVVPFHESPSTVVNSKEYKSLREDGERVHQLRQAYMAERFERGEHPDTHEDFWSEWKEPPVAVLKPVQDPVQAQSGWVQIALIGVGAVAVLSIFGIIVWKLTPRFRPPTQSG